MTLKVKDERFERQSEMSEKAYIQSEIFVKSNMKQYSDICSCCKIPLLSRRVTRTHDFEVTVESMRHILYVKTTTAL